MGFGPGQDKGLDGESSLAVPPQGIEVFGGAGLSKQEVADTPTVILFPFMRLTA
jgi:hypothetical protein